MKLSKLSLATSLLLIFPNRTVKATPDYDDERWGQLEQQAMKLFKARKYNKAMRDLQEALNRARTTAGDDDRIAISAGDLGGIYSLLGKEDKAKPLLEEARTIRAKEGKTGIPLGIQSEAFFEKATQLKGEAAHPDEQETVQKSVQQNLNNPASLVPQEWLTCEKNFDCTSVEVGCYYWQPVNKIHASEAKQHGITSCIKSVFAGPQPDTSCISQVCINGPYTVHYWKLLQADPINSAIQNHWIGQRVEACLQGFPPLGNWDFLSWRDVYFRALVDQAIKEKRFADNAPLNVLVSSVTSCEPLIRWQQDQMKWASAQANLRRRVRIENIPITYPLDDAYPPLIPFAKTFQQCGQAYINPGYTFSGDMHITFAIQPDGTVRLNLDKTTYPAAAYMRPYLSCVNTAFGKIIFPPPQDHRPASVTALIEIFSTGPKDIQEGD